MLPGRATANGRRTVQGYSSSILRPSSGEPGREFARCTTAVVRKIEPIETAPQRAIRAKCRLNFSALGNSAIRTLRGRAAVHALDALSPPQPTTTIRR